MNKQEQVKSSTKITKVSLVIYCLIMLVCFIVFMTISAMQKQYALLYAFLLCLAPGLAFICVSLLIPSASIIGAKLGKGGIVLYVITYVLKYAAIIGIPFIGLAFPENFNKWVMLAITLVAPIQVIITKIIFANYVSKSEKNHSK